MTDPVAEEDANLISAWLWLGLPFGYVGLEFGFRLLNETAYRQIWDSELGPGENLTFLFLAMAVVFGVLSLRHSAKLPTLWLKVWLVLVTLGSFYMAGEESSWGQHWFGWATPEAVANLNDQQETNLHNMSSWFDQKPRLAFELWILVAGFLYPLFAYVRRLNSSGTAARWFWPPALVFPTALLALLAPLPERLNKWIGSPIPPPLDIRSSEQQEALFAIFLLLYLLGTWRRLKSPAKRPV